MFIELTVRIFLTAVCLSHAVTSASSQIHDFVVKKGNKQLGVQKVERYVDGSHTRYEIQSDVSFSFVTKRHMVFTIHSEELDGSLVYAEVSELLNDKLRYSGSVERSQDTYVVKRDESYTTVPINSERVWSVSRLYFEEPVTTRHVFSERHGLLLNIEPSGDGMYELTMPNGSKNTYEYQNGECREVVVNHWIATIRIIRL